MTAKKGSCRLCIRVDYNPEVTDEDGLASALDSLLETVTSTPGILDEYGNPHFSMSWAVADKDKYDTVVHVDLTSADYALLIDVLGLVPEGSSRRREVKVLRDKLCSLVRRAASAQ